MSAGYSGTRLSKKLGIKPGHRVALLDSPEHAEQLLHPLPEGVSSHRNLRSRGTFDVVLAFVRTQAELRAGFARGQPRMASAGGLWVCWPKATSALASELRESAIRDHGLARGLVDNKVCAVDDDWSGLRFVVRLEDR